MISSMINKTTAPKSRFEVKSPIYSLAGDYQSVWCHPQLDTIQIYRILLCMQNIE